MRNKKEEVYDILSSIPEYIKKIQCDLKPWMKSLKCAVSSCPNAYIKDADNGELPYKFHQFPQTYDIRNKWMELCNYTADSETKTLMVCSDHFLLDDYDRNYREEFKNPNYRRLLKSTAVPSKQLTGQAITVEFNVDLPDLEEVKAHVNENEALNKTIVELEDEEKKLQKQLKLLECKIRAKQRNLSKLENKCKSLKKNVQTTNYHHKNVLSKVFTDAQINVLRGKRKTVWKDDDLAMAFSLRQMSSKDCYLYLKYNLNIPLPSLSAVQKWAASNN